MGSRIWCQTQVLRDSANFRWTIDHFSGFPLKTSGQCTRSSSFFAGRNEDTKWSLILFPYGIDSTVSSYLSVYLKLEESKYPAPLHVKYRIYRPDNPAEFKKDTFMVTQKRGYDKFTERQELEKESLLPGDRLVLHCDVMVYRLGEILSGPHAGDVGELPPEGRVATQLGALLARQQLCDVVVSVKGHDFPAHRVVLAARSPVFAAMFAHDTAERSSSRVSIPDLEPDVFSQLLNYAYTDEADVSVDLLAAADKYALENLKLRCQDALAATLNVDNAVDIYWRAEMHNADRLRDHALAFITGYLRGDAEQVFWDSLVTKHPQIVIQLFQDLLPSRKTSSK